MTKPNSTKSTVAGQLQSPLPTAPDVPRPPATSGGSQKKTTAPGTSPGDWAAPSPKPPSKQDQLAALVVRDEGATLDQLVAALGWLPHTTRAALTGLKRKGFAISSDKVDGVRTYRAVAPE